MADTVVEELRAWAAEIARNKEGHATWKEDCRVLNQAAKEIENPSRRKQAPSSWG